MINYTEKGASLHSKITRLGKLLSEENGVWVSSDDVAVQSIIDGYTLAESQAYKCAEVSDKAKQLRDKAVRSISAGEMASWPIKLAEAAKFAAGDTSCPMLNAEATARGITLAALVAKVDGNAQVFAGLEAVIGGVDGKHRDAIKALVTFDEVSNYDYSAGWPVV